MARLKSKPDNEIKDLEAADEALKELCRIEAELSIQDGRYNAKAARLAEEAKDKAAPLMERRERLVLSLTDYISRHRDLIPKKKKSVRLTHGELGVRQLTGKLEPVGANKAAKEAVEATAISNLEATHPECVKVTRKIDLPALRKAGPDVYEAQGFDLVGAIEEPWAKPNKVLVEDLANKLVAGK